MLGAMLLAILRACTQIFEQARSAAQVFLLGLLLLLLLLTVYKTTEEWLLAREALVERALLHGKLKRLLKVVIIGVLETLILQDALILSNFDSQLLDLGLDI